MPTVKAKLYGGATSGASEINLSLHQHEGFLVLNQSVNGKSRYNLSELTFEPVRAGLEIRLGSAQALEYVVVSDERMIDLIHTSRKEHRTYGVYQRLVDLRLSTHAFIALLIAGVIILSYMYVVPSVASKAVDVLPVEYERQLGKSVYDEFMMYNSIDEEKTQILEEIVYALDMPLDDVEVVVVESNMVNAFALPSGTVVVFTGIIDMMETSSELVGLLGHEYEHIRGRHSMKMMAQNLAGYLFLSAVLSDVNGIMGVLADNAHTLQNLSYSRDFEEEADQAGIDVLVNNNLDPKGMVYLFEHLQAHTDVDVPELLSSHPLTEDRIDFIHDQIENVSVETEYNSHIDSLFVMLKK